MIAIAGLAGCSEAAAAQRRSGFGDVSSPLSQESTGSAVSQLFWNRPLPELAQYRAPLAGLYLCGAGQHPGGEVSGQPGHNAAQEVLKDLDRGGQR